MILKNRCEPYRLSMRKSCKTVWNDWSYYEEKCGNYHPYKIAKRVLSHYIGKHIDLAFSHFCKVVKPYHYRKYFWQHIAEKHLRKNARYFGFSITDDGIVVLISRLKSPKVYKIKSPDFRVGYLDKKTGKVLLHEDIPFYLLYPDEKYTRSDRFEYGYIYSGSIQTFEKKDYRYKRALKEKRKLVSFKKEYCFLSESEKIKIKEDIENNAIMERHGFNKWSFRK